MANPGHRYAPNGSETTVAGPMTVPMTRAELEATYARPYRRWLPRALVIYRVHVAILATVLLGVVGLLGELAGDGGGPALALALASAVGTALLASWAAVTGATAIRAHTTDWRPADGPLARVRARRPHAAEADRDVAHDEYAVAVEGDDGLLVTFAFIPLAAHEDPARDAVLIRGAPRYDAREVTTAQYDPVDAARAAEQLADAQEHAAGLEAAAIERAHAELAADREARELLAETRSTGAALRDITGQGGD